MYGNIAKDTRSMIPLTHVCRYWRESIISTPENWTSISSRSMDLAALSLQRAKEVPLEISLDGVQIGKSPGFPDLLTSHIKNTESLQFKLSSSIQELAQALPNFPQSMPNLRSLSLIGRTTGWDWSADPFGPLTPTLTRLSLIDIPLYPTFLRISTLTNLTLYHGRFNLHLDTLLDFLEENRSLEHVVLDIEFTEAVFRNSRRRVAIRNRLRSLTIASPDAIDGHALISSIALQRGAHLEISLYDESTEVDDVLSIFSMAHFSNLESPTLMVYYPDDRSIRLLGPNGSFSFKSVLDLENPFEEFAPLFLSKLRVLRIHRGPELAVLTNPTTFPSSLPALETFTLEYGFSVSRLFSSLFSNPSSSPSLKTLAFLDCDLDDDFMEKLTRFASNRKKTTSAWLHRVVIVDSRGGLPSVVLIDKLGKYVPVVDVRIGKKLPADLI